MKNMTVPNRAIKVLFSDKQNFYLKKKKKTSKYPCTRKHVASFYDIDLTDTITV
jgi:hypothetical protein